QKKTVALCKCDQLLVRRPGHIVSKKVIDSSRGAAGRWHDPLRCFYFHPVKGLCQKLATIRGNALECDAPRRQCQRNGRNFAAPDGNLSGSNASGTRAKIRGEIETRSIAEQGIVEHRRRPSVVVLDVAVIGQLHELYRWGRMSWPKDDHQNREQQPRWHETQRT